ncbi:MAG: hypothetical protein JWM21_3594 [Acidobacteria bacterium]|nr:hypothetical protein [Acidobacteriota bacterium]
MKSHKPLSEPSDVLYRIKRGLSGYVSYLAACEMNASFSEYILYEPILRILTARGYEVQSEFACPGIKQARVGDKKKLDFVASKNGVTFALEVKWAKSAKPKIDEDLRKLSGCRQDKNWQAFLCIFGTESCIANIKLPDGALKERGNAVIAQFGKTRFGCRIYELAE